MVYYTVEWFHMEWLVIDWFHIEGLVIDWFHIEWLVIDWRERERGRELMKLPNWAWLHSPSGLLSYC